MSNNSKNHILYIEDDVKLAEQVKSELQKHDYAVDIAENGKQGLTLFDQSIYDLLIIDYHTPIINGLQVIETLVNRGVDTSFIMVTCGGSEELAVKVMKLGASDYILKDSNYINKLLDSIIEALENIKINNKEKVLFEGERRFKHVFSQANFPMAMVESQSGLFLHVSPAFCEMMGYSAKELSNLTFSDITHPDDENLSFQAHQDILTGNKTSFKMEKRYIHKSGKIVWVILSVLFIKRFDNKALYHIVHFENISLLRKAETMLDATLGAIVEGIVVFGKNDEIIYFNQQFIDMWRLPESAVNTWGNEKIVNFISDQLKDDSLFRKLQQDQLSPFVKVSTLECKDGRFYECVVKPQKCSGSGFFVCMSKPRGSCEQCNKIIARVHSLRDITKQKKAELAQQRSLRFLETVINNLPNPIYYKSQDGEFLGYNQAFVQAFFGKSQEQTEIPVEPLSSNQHRQMDAKLLEKGGMQTYETKEKYTDGSTQNLIFHKALFNIGNNKKGIVGTITNITKRKKAEKSLRISEERYALAQRAANIGSWDWDIKADKIHWSEQVEPMLGFDFGEFGKTYPDFLNCIHPYERKIFENAVRNKLKDNQDNNFEHEFRIVWLDGTIRWVSLVGDVIRNMKGESIRMIGVIHDITERKIAEEKLRLAEIVFNTSSEAIVVTNSSNRIIAVNPAYTAITGYTMEECIGSSPKILQSGRHDRKFYERMWADIKKKGKWHGEIWNKRKNGEIYPELLTITKIKKKVGQQAQYVAIFQDIIDIKQTEAELKIAKESAEAANRAKSEFLSNMSHEIRTPLNGILGFAQILETDSRLTAEQLDGIQTIKKSGEHLLTLINDILDLSKIESGKMELHEKELYFQSFLKNVVDIVEVRARQAKIQFSFQMLSPLPEVVKGDETRLRQVLINLLGNAVKFTKKGEVTFNVGYHGDKIRFEVHDTGTGIDAEQLECIFEPFQQVGKKEYMIEGTGLGLPISKKFVAMMGGELQVESKRGEGSTFFFEIHLPVIHGYQKHEKSQFRIKGFTGKPRKILVVDDEFINRALLNRLLSAVGFSIIEAENGKQGVENAIAHLPDVILIDLLMPVMDGFTAIQKIRQIPELKDTVIIVISANVFEQHRQKSFEAGCDDFLGKPINVQKILEIIANHLKLKWIYEIENSETQIESKPAEIPHFDESVMPIPSQEIIDTLYNLSLVGDIEGLAEQAVLLKEHGEYGNFATEIETMASNFQIREIRELIESLRQ